MEARRMRAADLFEQRMIPAEIARHARQLGVTHQIVSEWRKAWWRALSAALALAVAPMEFGVAQFRATVQSMTGQAEADYTHRHAAYDLKKLRGKQLITKLGRSRRYEVSASSMRAVSALYVLRDQVIRPVLAGVRTTQQHPNPYSRLPSTDTTNAYASTCSPSFRNSASPHEQRHCRSLFVSA
jgi:hypothetical protein